MSLVAFLDTCVLYPSYLRDTLLSVAEAGYYRPIWSTDILEELQRNLVEDGIPEANVAKVIAQMRVHFADSEVAGYQTLIGAMTCDEKDRHVLAAAVHGRASFLVTLNLRDFPSASTELHEIDVVSPDDFVLDFLDLAPGSVLRILAAQATRYKREPKTVNGLLLALARGGAPDFAAEVRRLMA